MPKPSEQPWPEPDPWQCEYVTDDGRRCVFGRNHTVDYHRPERVMPAADPYLPEQSKETDHA
jgi:hypothetical protein